MQVFVKVIPPLRPKVQVGSPIVEDFKDVIHLFQFLPELFRGKNAIGYFVDETSQTGVLSESGFHPGTGIGQSVGVFVKLNPGVFQSSFLFRPYTFIHGGAGFLSSRFDVVQGSSYLVQDFRAFAGSLGGFASLVNGLRGLIGSGSIGGCSDIDV